MRLFYKIKAWFKLLQLFNIVIKFSHRALKADKVSYNAALDLGTKLALTLNIPAGFKQYKNIALSGDEIWGSLSKKEDKKS